MRFFRSAIRAQASERVFVLCFFFVYLCVSLVAPFHSPISSGWRLRLLYSLSRAQHYLCTESEGIKGRAAGMPCHRVWVTECDTELGSQRKRTENIKCSLCTKYVCGIFSPPAIVPVPVSQSLLLLCRRNACSGRIISFHPFCEIHDAARRAMTAEIMKFMNWIEQIYYFIEHKFCS